MSTKSKRFIGVAWPYVNGDLHIGHLAGYLLPADIFARFSRATGHEVLMASGSDCFGTPIVLEADKKKITPAEVVEEYHAKDVALFKETLDLTYDIYTRTDHPNHIAVTQDIFLGMLKHGYIFIKKTLQYYSPTEAKFLPDRYVEGTCKNCGYKEARSDQCDNCGKVLDHDDLADPKSKLSGSSVELKETEHYFIDWPKLQPKIERHIKRVGPKWKNWVYQEAMGWLKTGLKPRAISRDLDWGVPIPTDKIPPDQIIDNVDQKRLYVWFDAVIGYLSASKLWAKENGGDWESFWKNKDASHYYFMGKDNLIFHTIFWPGQLIGYDETLHLPDVPAINMFLNYDGKQFSKSRGHSIPIKDTVERYGNDVVRFYLTLIMPEAKDASFNWEDFYHKNNEILVGNFGNFIHRVLSIAVGVDIAAVREVAVTRETAAAIEQAFTNARTHGDSCEFRNLLDDVLTLSSYGNKYLNDEKLWELKKTDPAKFNEVLAQLYAIIIALTYLAQPLLPGSVAKIASMIGIKLDLNWPAAGEAADSVASLLKTISNEAQPTPLFAKLDPQEL